MNTRTTGNKQRLDTCGTGRALKLLVVTALVALLGACGDSSEEPAPAPSPSPPPLSKTFDPPQSFDDQAGILLPKDVYPQLVALDGTIAYMTVQDRFYAFDLQAGRTIGTAKPENEVLPPSASEAARSRSRAPILTRLNGQALAVVPFTVIIPGAGTTAGRYGVEFTAMDTKTHELAWTRAIELPTPAREARGEPQVTVAGIEGSVLVFSSVAPEGVVTYGVDLAGPKVLWKVDNVRAGAVASGTVIGVEPYDASKEALVGQRLSDGSRAWRQEGLYEVSVASAGPRFALVSSRNYVNGERDLRVLDRAGNVTAPVDNREDGKPFECAYDLVSASVCSRRGYVFGVDAETGQVLWELRDDAAAAERIAPTVTAARHGLIYGETEENGPVVIDARTGQDRNASPGVAPVVVNERCGVAGTPNKGVRCYPATG